MKKIIIFTMLLASICSTALAQTADDYDSETIKHAYNAPRSAFINKWIDASDPNISYTFKSDGTVILTKKAYNETVLLHFALQVSGKWTWTPSQRRLTITMDFPNAIFILNQKDWAKQSERLKKGWAVIKKNLQTEMRSMGTIIDRLLICRIDDDYLMWMPMGNFDYDATPDVFISESTYKAMRY